MSGQGDFGDDDFRDVWDCNCDTDLCNSASKQTIAVVFTLLYVLTTVIL